MKRMTVILLATMMLAATAARGQANFDFREIEGDWQGTLEYLDYTTEKRVELKTYLSVKASPDGLSARVETVYDDFGKIIKTVSTVRFDSAAAKYFDGDSEYRVESAAPGRLVLTGRALDGEKIEPVRRTLTFTADSLVFLKETRDPWRFRNRLALRRAEKAVPAPRAAFSTGASGGAFSANLRWVSFVG